MQLSVTSRVQESRSNLEPVSQRATLGTLLTVRPASDFAVCSVTPVRTFGWSVCIITVKFQYPNIASGSQTGLRRGGGGGPADPSPGHVGVFGGVLISQRRPTRRGWDGGRRRPILVRKQRGRAPPPQSTGVPVEGGLAGRRSLTGPSRVVTTRLFSEIYWPTGSLGTANRRNRPSKVGYDLSTK